MSRSSGSDDPETEVARDGSHHSHSFRGPAEPTDGHERSNDHFALVYEEQTEQFAGVVPFVRRGLERGERCLYVAADNSREEVLTALRDAGIDADAALDSGALELMTPTETYRRTGEFDGEAMFDYWTEALSDAKSEGYTGIRAAAEMTWALEGTDAEQLTEYEALLNRLYEGEDYTVLCQYDRNRFSDDLIRDVIETHPFVVQGNTISRNVYYTPPEKFFGPDRPADEVDRKLRTLRERTESKTALRDHERYLHDLYEIIADTERSFDERLQAVFDLGCERFDMDMGGLARVNPETDRFEVEATNRDHGDLVPDVRYPLSETYCRATVADGGTCAVTDAAEYEDKLCYDQFGVRTYLGTYLEFDDAEDRTFWFVSGRPREAITSDEKTFHHLMGQWVQYELQQQHQADRLVALNSLNETARDINRALAQQSTRAEVEQVVCDRLVELDPYAFAWVGALEDGDVVPTTAANEFDPPERTFGGPAAELADRAVRTGDVQIERDPRESAESDPLVQGPAGSVTGLAAVPIAHEDRQYGVLVVYTTRGYAFDDRERDVVTQLGEIAGLATTAIEHERELQYERERLEFFNRLVRHNLLNDLNTVRAQATILEDAVDPGADRHLRTIRDRVDEMADHIQGLRSLMKAVVESGEHELEPVDLTSVLESEIDRARHAFDDAEFEVGSDVGDAGRVLADDLLGDLFRNLLSNAVQHNDTSRPSVAVEVEARGESVTVRVADDGPGIPDEVRDRIFAKGVKGLESPGTGFGLHLVREIVDIYGGSITIDDRDSGGTVFSVALPRPTSTDR